MGNQTEKEQISREAETNKDKDKNKEDKTQQGTNNEKTSKNDKTIQSKDKEEDKEINKIIKNNQQSKKDAKITTNKKTKTKTSENDDEEGEEYLYEILKKLDNEPQCEYDLFEEEKEIEENTETIEVYTDRTIYTPRNAANVMIPIGITHKHKKLFDKHVLINNICPTAPSKEQILVYITDQMTTLRVMTYVMFINPTDEVQEIPKGSYLGKWEIMKDEKETPQHISSKKLRKLNKKINYDLRKKIEGLSDEEVEIRNEIMIEKQDW